MAKLKLQDNSTFDELSQIREQLSVLNIELDSWKLPTDQKANALLKESALGPEQKEELLKVFDDRFEEQKKLYGYKTRDLIVIHPDIPKLDELLAVFNKIHTHDDDEVRYIVDGYGFFGFVCPDQAQLVLKVEAGEYIRVPKGTKHWFYLDSSKRIKAVRYFTDPAGWVANYTGDSIKL